MIELPSWQHGLVLLSVAVSVAGGLSCVRSTRAGRTKPNRVTWGMWAAAPLIATAVALSNHADPWATTGTFLAGLIPLLVFAASFGNKSGYWKLTPFDFLCGAWSLAALVAWLLADAPEAAILFAVLSDAFAAIPTIKKTWQHPETENRLNFLTSLVSVALVLPSIPVWNVTNASFQAYLLALNAILLSVACRRRGTSQNQSVTRPSP